MSNLMREFEVNLSSNVPCNSNKKMRKRKQFDTPIKFRSIKPNSHDLLRSSEDELFLPHQKPTITKSRSFRSRRYWNYLPHILTFGIICFFLIACIGLTHKIMELRREVQNLSSHVNQIEQKFSHIKTTDLLSTIEQIKTRLNFLENLNFSFIHQSSSTQERLIETQMNERINEWNDRLNSFRKEMSTLNRSAQIEDLLRRFEQLTSLAHNSTDKASVLLNVLQADFNQLRDQIDQCECSKS